MAYTVTYFASNLTQDSAGALRKTDKHALWGGVLSTHGLEVNYETFGQFAQALHDFSVVRRDETMSQYAEAKQRPDIEPGELPDQERSQYYLPYEQLAEKYKDARRRKDGGAYVTGSFGPDNKGDHKRKKECWRFASALSLDLEAQDGAADAAAAALARIPAALEATGIECVYYQTHSSTPNSQRWRVVIPLSETITESKTYQAVAAAVAFWLCGRRDVIDNRTPTQAQFLPTWSSDAPDRLTHYRAGKPLDWRSFLDGAEARGCVLPDTPPAPCDVLSVPADGGALSVTPRSARDTILTDTAPAPCDVLSVTPPSAEHAERAERAERGDDDALWNGPILSGKRHDTLLAIAGKRLKRLGENHDVYLEYIEHSKRCTPLLESGEVEKIWADAVVHYHTVVERDPNYIPPALYHDRQNGGGGAERKNKTQRIKEILRTDPCLKGLFGFDEFQGRKVVIRRPPWEDGSGPFITRLYQNLDAVFVRSYLGEKYDLQDERRIADEIEIAAQAHKSHPVKDYLKSLHWDGVQRAETYFIDYLAIIDEPYSRAVTRLALLAAVRRIFEPGIKFDYMITLVGAKQGTGKSQTIRNLCIHCPDWFTDSITDIKDKDTEALLSGHWIIEIAELAALGKGITTTNQVKSFISRQDASVRLPYDREKTLIKRQCVFMASTNDDVFLEDPTGNRRFWALSVPDDAEARRKKNPLDVKPQDIDQVWAEVMHWYNHGGRTEILALPPELEAIAIRRQEDHCDADIVAGMIEAYLSIRRPVDWYTWSTPDKQAWLDGYPKTAQAGDEKEPAHDVTCVKEVFEEALKEHYKGKKLNRQISNEITRALSKLGFVKRYTPNGIHSTARFGTFGTQKAWYKPSDCNASAAGDEADIPF